MQTTWGQLFIGVLMWTLVMLLPNLISYFKTANPTVSVILLTTLYPTILSHLSRQGSFWISYPVLMYSSAIALVISLVLIYLVKTKNETVLSVVPLVVFCASLTFLSSKINMYNNSVINY